MDDPATIGTALGSAIAVLMATFWAVRHRASKSLRPPAKLTAPPPGDTGRHMALTYDDLPSTGEVAIPAAAFRKMDAQLDALVAIANSHDYCTKSDLDAIGSRLGARIDRLEVADTESHARMTAEITKLGVSVAVLEERTRPK